MPTILDLVNVAAPSRVQGASLLPVIRNERATIRDFAISSLTYVTDDKVRCPTSFRTRDRLYVYGGDEWPSELYSLRADPGETRNVIDDNRDAARRLHARYLAFLQSVACPKASLEARKEFGPTPRADLPYRRVL
jgi:arylsulfatase A-like enzyme